MWACVLSPYKNILSERMHATVKKVLFLWVLITRSNYPSVMSTCNQILGHHKFLSDKYAHSNVTYSDGVHENLAPPVATKRWMVGAAGTKQLCPEIAYFLSSHIAVVRETGRSVLTGQQFTTAHSDSDLSVLNTVAFSNET